MLKKAVLGGSFNPIHLGHLLIAETALDQLALQQVIWVPTYRPLYKSAHNLLDFDHRLAMVKLAIASHPSFTVSTVERNPSHSSYAIDTFLGLQSLYTASQWYWIIGLDAFLTLPRWYRRQELSTRCTWLVAPRLANFPEPAAKAQTLFLCEQVVQKMAVEAIELQWHILEMPHIGISSRLIRQYCSDRRSIRYLVPDAVKDYIFQQDLYKT